MSPEPSSPAAAAIDPDAAWRVLVDALDVLPGAELIDREDWVQLRTPSSRVHNHNKVMRAKLKVDEVDARIAQVLADHAERGASLLWWVDQNSRPDDLPARLQAAGFVSVGRSLGMVRAVDGPPFPAPPKGVSVRQATERDCECVGEMTGAVWGRSTGHVAANLARRVFAGEAQGVSFWLAYDHRQPVGVSMLRILPSLGYLQGAAVLPPSRGKGIYRALTWARIAELHRRGLDRVVIWANPETSGPPAQKMGFTAVARAQLFEWRCP